MLILTFGIMSIIAFFQLAAKEKKAVFKAFRVGKKAVLPLLLCLISAAVAANILILIIPMVNSAAEAREAVAACRYPSSGRRGCGVRRGAAYGKMPFDEYMQRSGSEPLVIIQIEHIDAVAELDEILAIPELDCICIGPADFSGSMGKVNHPEAPEIAEKIDEIARTVKAAGKYLGTATGCDPETLAVWKKRQVDWICLGSDWGAMVTAWRQNLKSSLKILQEK